MRAFFNGLILGIIFGALAFWYIQKKAGEHPEAQQRYEQAAEEGASNVTHAAESMSEALRARLDHPGDESELVVEDQDLRGWSFAGADLAGVNLIGCDLSGCDLSAADLAYGHHALSRFCSANLTGAQLLKANYTEADFSDAVLLDAKALRADFRDARLRRADLSGAELTRTSLVDADLRFARMIGANLHNAWLTGAKLHGADLATAREVQTADADWIDVGPEGQEEILRGEAARAWLLRAAAADR